MQATINGINMTFDDEGSGIPLLFVHGFPLSHHTWDKQLEALRADHRVIAPDLRGFGDTPSTPGPALMSQYADDLAALLTHLKLDSAVVIGNSMGGYIALAFAARHPHMLRGLALVATRAGADTPDAAAGRRATAEKVTSQGAAGLIANMAPKMLAPANTDPTMAEQVRGFMSAASPEGVSSALLGMADRPDSTPMLATIAVPTLVITGTDDTLIPPAESEKMAAAIPAAQLEKISNAGHLVAFERPDDFNLVLRNWLALIHA